MKPKEFWIRDNKKHYKVESKDGQYACFDHSEIDYPDYHVIEYSAYAELKNEVERLKEYEWKYEDLCK